MRYNFQAVLDLEILFSGINFSHNMASLTLTRHIDKAALLVKQWLSGYH
jgi:hypothetical protein